MRGVNKAILIGRVGQDPEVKLIGEGTLTTFSIATNRKYKNKAGDWVEETQWHRIEAWGTIAENMGKLIKKGKNVYIEGEIRNNKYTDKDGNKRESTIIMTQNFSLLSPLEDNNRASSEESATKSVREYADSDSSSNAKSNAKTVTASASDIQSSDDDDDDLPF